MKKEIGQIRNRFFNEKTLLRGSIKNDRAGRCNRDRCSPVFVTSVPAACMHHNILHIIIYDIYKSPVITVSHFPSLSLSLCHCLTHFLSFGHNSKYPIGPGCRCWSIWSWDRSGSKPRPPIHLSAIKCD